MSKVLIPKRQHQEYHKVNETNLMKIVQPVCKINTSKPKVLLYTTPQIYMLIILSSNSHVPGRNI